MICDVVMLWDDECQDGYFSLLFFLFLFLFFFFFFPPDSFSSPVFQEPQKNVFQMNTGKDVSPGDGLLTPVQLLIIKFSSSQTKAVLPNLNYPGKCKIRTL